MYNTEAVFFDRDGTLGENANIEFPKDFVPFEGIKNVFEEIKGKGIKVFIFTNQSCIARKKDFGYDFAKEFISYGADDWFICPHDAQDNCPCRKPKNSLLLKAREKYGLNLNNCFVVGDRWTDIQSGLSVNAKTILVRTGRGKDCEYGAEAEKYNKLVDYICDDFKRAAKIILNG